MELIYGIAGVVIGGVVAVLISEIALKSRKKGIIKEAEKEAENPPLFKKMFAGDSVEQQALNAVIAKKKIEEQERQVRELITWAYGVETYKEMMQMRKNIKAKRERMIYKQRRRQRRMLDVSAIIMGLIVSGGVVWTTASIIQGLSNG